MNDWPDYPEYNEINNKIDIITSQINRVSKQIDFNISHFGCESEGLNAEYDKLCDKRMELIQERHAIARKLF